ncbi:MAG: glycosyltransferase [Verrucomicrobia bacterium]|jgi:glycosyltransferase involved in cell wall biosynthesis|nr:glycosyltransferase [Verrucomicrobiota bacterium]
MRILSIAYPFAAVGTDSVGGAEQILLQLDRALIDAGHESIVVACGGSRVTGHLIQTPPIRTEITPELRARIYARVCEILSDAVNRFDPDLVHMHGVDFYQYLPADDRPVLVTLHLPVSFYPGWIFQLQRLHIYLVCVSKSQYRTCPPSAITLSPIENGVPLPFEQPVSKEDYAVCLSRIAPEKNTHVALAASREARIRCFLAGQVFGYREHQQYHKDVVTPLLDRERQFIGAVDEQEKWRLLSKARCLLQPSLAPETSSLVAMEALACGTPVIAFPSGALPEIIDNGKTGFLVRSATEMARAILVADRIRPEDCLDAARARFSGGRMTREYIELYEELISGTTEDLERMID